MGKTSTVVKDRWNAKAYDQVAVRVPKGRKADIEAYAKEKGKSINGLINDYLKDLLGMSEEEWKRREAAQE